MRILQTLRGQLRYGIAQYEHYNSTHPVSATTSFSFCSLRTPAALLIIFTWAASKVVCAFTSADGRLTSRNMYSSLQILVRGTLGVGLFASGDLLAQKLERHNAIKSCSETEPPPFAWDEDRAVRTSSWRAVIWAPAATVFWNILDRNVKVGGFRGSLLKIAIDFCTIGPMVTYSYLAWCKTWELGREVTVPTVLEHCNERFVTVISRSYTYWLPLHLITYGVVPLRHRLVWVSLCSIGFAAILSFTNSEYDEIQRKKKNGKDAAADAQHH